MMDLVESTATALTPEQWQLLADGWARGPERVVETEGKVYDTLSGFALDRDAIFSCLKRRKAATNAQGEEKQANQRYWAAVGTDHCSTASLVLFILFCD